MRHIVIDPDRTSDDDVVRNLVFAADGQRLGGVLGERGTEAVRAWRYDLVADEALPNPDDEDYEVERFIGAPDPVWGSDLELLAEVLLDDRGNQGLRVTDFWAKPTEAAWLTADEGHTPTAYNFSADGAVLYAATNDRGAALRYWLVEHLLEAPNPRDVPFEEIAFRSPAEINAVRLGEASSWVACAVRHAGIQLIDLTGENPSRTLTHRVGNDWCVSEALAFSDRGDRLLSVCGGHVAAWAVGDGFAPLCDRLVDATAAAFTSDGGIVAATASGDVVFLDPLTYAETRRLDFGVGPLWGVAVAADGLTAAVGAANGRAVVFDLE